MSPPIEVTDLRLAYRLYRNRAGTMKEYAVNALRRQVVYDTLWALDGVDFVVEPGETLGVIGPNGAGKSTLLKVLAGVIPPADGRVVVRGQVAPMIEISGGLNLELSGRENIIIFGALLGRSAAFMRERVDAIAEWAGLTDFLNVPVRSYSSGMQARLAFSIATDVKPDVLLIDEVLAVGDEEFRRRSSERIDSLMDGGTSVVLVSHSLDTIVDLSDRALWLDHGRMKMIGPAGEVAAEYRASS